MKPEDLLLVAAVVIALAAVSVIAASLEPRPRVLPPCGDEGRIAAPQYSFTSVGLTASNSIH